MDLMSMWPLMAMMRNNGQNGLGDPGRFDRLDQDRYGRDPQSIMPPGQTAPPPVAPRQPIAPAGNNPHSTPQVKPVSAAHPDQSPAQHPARTPDKDGNVSYLFPDGKTQLVSVVVAQALDVAFADHTGTDAQRAYANTRAKWADSKRIGDRVDPSQLMTGDVAVWRDPDRTALVRTLGEGTDAVLEVIVKGKLTPFTPQMPETPKSSETLKPPESPNVPGNQKPSETPKPAAAPKPADAPKTTGGTGDFGEFAGFAHPRGAELAGPADKPEGGTVSVAPDPSAAPLTA
ncbi:hypothetical protein [Nocardia sp. NPDC004722]